MIGLLRGQLLDSELDGTLLIDVQGIGYEVHAPIDVVERLERDDAGHVTLFVHTHAREDALMLFGFASRDERLAFRALITLPKVGPKLAIAVLSVMSVTELAEVVEAGPASRLTKVPGIGKKTAERMLIDLKGKLRSPLTSATAARQQPPSSAGTPQSAVVVDALIRMGFKPTEAQRAVASLTDLDRPLGELVREALAQLSP